MKTGSRSLKKYVIFPCCVLIFGALEEVAVYKGALIENDFLRVGALMAFFAFGISIIAYFFTPLIDRTVVRMHAASKREGGRWGEYFFVLLLLATVYLLWFQINVHGPQSLLPMQWRN